MNSKNIEIHQRAIRRGKAYLKSEAELIESIQEVDEHKVYSDFNCRNLHIYVSQVMELGDAVASNFITVARKAKEVPALQEVIRSGKLQVQKARKITSVLTQENQDFWLKLAVEQPQSKVEKEVARVNPDAARPERVKYIADKRLNVNLNISEEVHELLLRVQDLESQRLKKAAKLEHTLEASLRAYLEKNDPLEKAKRAVVRQEKKKEHQGNNTVGPRVSRHVKPSAPKKSKRPARASELEHQRNLRDQGQCTYVDPDGKRCEERRWLQAHHIIPVSDGGEDTLENLKTLCFGHHRLMHHHTNLSDQVVGYRRLTSLH